MYAYIYVNNNDNTVPPTLERGISKVTYMMVMFTSIDYNMWVMMTRMSLREVRVYDDDVYLNKLKELRSPIYIIKHTYQCMQ